MKTQIQLTAVPPTSDEVAESLGIPRKRREEIRLIVEESARRYVSRQKSAKAHSGKATAKAA